MIKIIISFILLFNSSVYAFDVETRSFLTFAYRLSNTEVPYDGSITNEGDYSGGTTAGLQFYSNLSKRNEAFLQIVTEGDRGRGFEFNLDIAHITFQYANHHKALFGKIRLPVWMTSDYKNVGALYPWVNQPEEVYKLIPIETVGVDDTFFGISLEGQLYQVGHHEFNYRFYNGGNEGEEQNRRTRVKNLHGLNLSYRYDNFTLHLNYLNALSKGEMEVSPGTFVEDSFGRAEYLTLGSKYEGERLMVLSEFSRVTADKREYEDLRSFYTTAGVYLFDQRYLLHGTFSKVLNSSKTIQDLFQKSYSVGINYNLDLSTVIKIEHKIVDLQTKQAPPGPSNTNQAGLFSTHPDKDVRITSISVNAMF